MQFVSRGLLAAGLLFSNVGAFKLTDLHASKTGSPVDQVVTLLEELKTKLKEDEATETTAYDEYACWCEDTLAQKAKDITAAKKTLEELQTLITKLKAELASHAVSIEQLKKEVDGTEKSIKESTQVRENEHEQYASTRTQSEQCIGALEAAVGVLTNAGSGNTGFLGTFQQAQLISAAAGVREVISKASSMSSVSKDDLQVVKSFVATPMDFIAGAKQMLSAVQVANKGPRGDYAPQSGQVQGVLKGLYDSFTADLEKANAEEALKQKAFEELMETKKKELETLKATLLSQETAEADKTKTLADSETEQDDTAKQLEEDEKFFAESKAGCKTKAQEWAERTRLRTEELHGINTALNILTGPNAAAIFENATTTFLQISDDRPRAKKASLAYEKIKAMAGKFKNMRLAKIAVMLRTKGHFDKVINAIDKMIILLKQEAKEDIQHKERCQAQITDNTQTMEDLDYAIEKVGKEIERMEKKVEELKGNVQKLGEEINSTTDELAELNKMRTKEADEFMQAMKDDNSAVALLGQAITALSRTHAARNAASLSQVAKKQDPPPSTWEDGGKANTRKEESGGIIAILESIKTDLEEEMKTAQSADNTALANYASDRKMMEKMIATASTSLLAFREELIFTEARTIDKKEFKDMKDKDLESEKEREEALKKDCGWIETDFAKRRDSRIQELNGLAEAKAYLQGVSS
jgi:DNA repair exonuclease SbcCD ATPase subunit